jgi:predicted AlkP superfamily pyrophosphatase or phosphodiesterase
MRRLLRLCGLALLLAACRTPSSREPRRVVMLSLDGADAATLHRLYQEGTLDAGGFARFFREGQVAESLIPVDPTITAPNHISLATGYPAGETGIVANHLHLPDAPLGKLASGFAVDIETETLWEAARRQGLRVGVSAWPGADGRNERRRGDWGMTYSNDPDRKAELVTLSRGDWGPSPLKAGEWGLVPCRKGGRPERPACQVKVLEIDPALEKVRVYISGEYPLRAYPETFQSELESAGLIWTGPPDDKSLEAAWAGRPGIDLETWVEQDERFSTFFMDALLATARHAEWDLLMGYTAVIDEAGHRLLLTDPRQPGYSPARRDELDRARTRVWQSVDRELARLLAAVDLRTTTVLVVSDHGMTPVHTQLDVDALLREWDLAAQADAAGGGGICHVYVQPDLPDRERFLDTLRSRLAAWLVDGDRPVERVFTRAEAAEIGMDHPRSGDLILFARPGFYFRDADDPVGDASVLPARIYGKHGYLNTHPAMQGIYLALGRGVAKGSAGTVRNTEVAGRVAAWLGIEKPRTKRTTRTARTFFCPWSPWCPFSYSTFRNIALPSPGA